MQLVAPQKLAGCLAYRYTYVDYKLKLLALAGQCALWQLTKGRWVPVQRRRSTFRYTYVDYKLKLLALAGQCALWQLTKGRWVPVQRRRSTF